MGVQQLLAQPEGGTDQVVVAGCGGQGVAELALVQGLTTTSSSCGGEIAQSGILALVCRGRRQAHASGGRPISYFRPKHGIRLPLDGS